MSNQKTTLVSAKVMVHLGKGVVKGPADEPWDCPDKVLGVLLEQDAVEVITVADAAGEDIDPSVQAIMDEGNKAGIEAELKFYNQSFLGSAKKQVLAAQLVAVRTDQVQQIKESMTVDEIQEELWTTHGVEYPKEAKEAELAAMLLTARRTAGQGE